MPPNYHSLVTRNGTYYAADHGTRINWSDEHEAFVVIVRKTKVYVADPDALFDAPLPAHN